MLLHRSSKVLGLQAARSLTSGDDLSHRSSHLRRLEAEPALLRFRAVFESTVEILFNSTEVDLAVKSAGIARTTRSLDPLVLLGTAVTLSVSARPD